MLEIPDAKLFIRTLLGHSAGKGQLFVEGFIRGIYELVTPKKERTPCNCGLKEFSDGVSQAKSMAKKGIIQVGNEGDE